MTSSRREGTSSGRRPTDSASSATRAARLAERTAANVAMASTSVPAPVVSDEMVVQSVTCSPLVVDPRAAVGRQSTILTNVIGAATMVTASDSAAMSPLVT